MEASAFKQRFMPHWRHLFWTAWRLTGNSQDAEDLVQEAFLKLWTKRDALGNIENDEAYLTTFVTNLFRDQRRRRRLAMADSTEETLAVADESNLVKRIEEREETEQVVKLIGQLPQQQRRVLTLHAVEELSPKEIETQTGLTAVNIRSLLSRARKNIKQKLKNT